MGLVCCGTFQYSVVRLIDGIIATFEETLLSTSCFDMPRQRNRKQRTTAIPWFKSPCVYRRLLTPTMKSERDRTRPLRPVDSASPVLISTPPPPTTPQQRRKSAVSHSIADDTLPAGLFGRDRFTPLLSKSPLGLGTIPEAAKNFRMETPPSQQKLARQMDQFDRLVKSATRQNAALPRESPSARVEQIVKAAMQSESSKRALAEDLRRIFADHISRRGLEAFGACPPGTSPEDPVQKLAKVVCSPIMGDMSSATSAVVVDAVVDKEIASFVSKKPNASYIDPNLQAPKPVTKPVAADIAMLLGAARKSTKKILKSDRSAFSDATTRTSEASVHIPPMPGTQP